MVVGHRSHSTKPREGTLRQGVAASRVYRRSAPGRRMPSRTRSTAPTLSQAAALPTLKPLSRIEPTHWGRATFCFRKIDARLIAQDHASVPLDSASGRAVMTLEP